MAQLRRDSKIDSAIAIEIPRDEAPRRQARINFGRLIERPVAFAVVNCDERIAWQINGNIFFSIPIEVGHYPATVSL